MVREKRLGRRAHFWIGRRKNNGAPLIASAELGILLRIADDGRAPFGRLDPWIRSQRFELQWAGIFDIDDTVKGSAIDRARKQPADANVFFFSTGLLNPE